MNHLRSTTRARLAAGGLGAAAIVAASGALASGSLAGSGEAPPAKPLANAIADGLSAAKPAGVSARIRFENRLITSSSLTGAGSPLLTGASGRVWLADNGHLRLELQSDAGDVQITSDGTTLNVYDATSKTDYRIALPKQAADTGSAAAATPTPATIQTRLDELARSLSLSGAVPTSLAGQGAYSVRVSPKQDGGLVGAAELAWDAARGVPLHAAIYATGSQTPVLDLTVTDIHYGPVAQSDVDVPPPADAKVQTIALPAGDSDGNGTDKGMSSLTPTEAQKGLAFTLRAPDTVAGLTRGRIIRNDARSAIVTYGKGLATILVWEQKPEAGSKHAPGGSLGLPKVSLAGGTGSELSTPLGTVVSLDKAGVRYIIAGSAPTASLEAIARELLA